MGSDRSHNDSDSRVPLDEKVAFLSTPQAYPEETETVEPIETHLSWVFLTKRFVYKFKKPQHYSFLDFRTLQARLDNCEREVRLNSELAPEIYLGLVQLAHDSGEGLNLRGRGETVEYLVKMRRLDDDQCLETQLKNGSVERKQVEAAADRLARFYIRQPPEGPIERGALKERIQSLRDELDELPVNTGSSHNDLSNTLLEALERYSDDIATRTIQEVHGDLRPEHVYLGEAPLFIDRLEFNRSLRLMDPLEELSFFAMECDRKGAGWIGECFITAYREHTETDCSPALLDFYTGFRALLWAVLSARHLPRGDHRKPWEKITNHYLEYGLEAMG